MAREELARLLSRLPKRGQSTRCCNDLAEFKSGLFAELLHGKNSFRWCRFLLLRGTAESGASKANALPGGAKRLAVRAVKGAQFAFIGAKRETLDRRSGLCAGPGIVRTIAPELERDRPRQLSPPGTARFDAWPSPLCHDRSASHDLQPYRRGDPVSRRDSAGIYASLESRHRDGRELIQLWFGPLASPWNRKRRRRHSSAIPFGFTDGSFDGSDELRVYAVPFAQRLLVARHGCAFNVQFGHDRRNLSLLRVTSGSP